MNARRFSAFLLLLVLAACSHKVSTPAPPKVEGAPALPQETSTIVVPVSAKLAELEAAINQSTPRQLWQIDQHQDACVPAQHVNLKFVHVKVLPDLGCRIVGQVVRGPITLGGTGSTLAISFPVKATIAVKDVGGVIKQKTATGGATVRADARLGIAGNWQPTAKVTIGYGWTDPPGIDFLGKRITFVSKADDKLKGVIAGLQRDLPKQLAAIHLRDKLANVWRQGFTAIQLNGQNPPAWMRITPKRLGFGGYRIEGRQLTMTLAAEALTETFVGPRPSDPVPTPLPPPSPSIGPRGLRFFIPVLADYGQLEPVVGRALGKLAKKGINLTGIGPVDAKFGKVTIYATGGGRIAVGVDASVKARSVGSLATKGRIWLTAIPYNEVNSQAVRARDIQLTGETDSNVVNLLFQLFKDGAVRDAIRQGLAHDFAPDYTRVLGKARAAIGQKREGDFILSADVGEVHNGLIEATGAGLFLPIRAQGQATIRYAPR